MCESSDKSADFIYVDEGTGVSLPGLGEDGFGDFCRNKSHSLKLRSS